LREEVFAARGDPSTTEEHHRQPMIASVVMMKMTNQLETPREGVMNIAAIFPSVVKPRLSIQ
jgi:hypothetical protein